MHSACEHFARVRNIRRALIVVTASLWPFLAQAAAVVTPPPPDAASFPVTVTVDAEFNWIFPGVFNLFGANFTNPMSLSGEAVMRNEGSS